MPAHSERGGGGEYLVEEETSAELTPLVLVQLLLALTELVLLQRGGRVHLVLLQEDLPVLQAQIAATTIETKVSKRGQRTHVAPVAREFGPRTYQ